MSNTDQVPATWVVVVLDSAVTVYSERLLQFLRNCTSHHLKEFLPLKKCTTSTNQ